MKLKSLLNSILMMILLFGGVLFFTGCNRDQEVVSSVEEQSIDQRVIEMVQKATNDPILQKEMQAELQHLVDQRIVDIESPNTYIMPSTEITASGTIQTFDYHFNGDQTASRDWVQEDMEYHKKNPSVSLRSHRRADYFVNSGSYTVYVHPGVPTAWATAISQACSAWNGLNLIVNLGPVSANDYLTNHYGAITVFMYNIPNAYADAPSPYSDGRPGHRIRIDTDSPTLTASQKKLIIAHELGHTLGFKHTDTSEGYALNSSTHSCISSTCNSADVNSIMRPGVAPVPSWAGFSFCDDNVFKCIY